MKEETMDRNTNEFGCFWEIIVAYCGCDELARFLGLNKKRLVRKTLYDWQVNTIGVGGSTVGRKSEMRLQMKKLWLAIFENCLVVFSFNLRDIRIGKIEKDSGYVRPWRRSSIHRAWRFEKQHSQDGHSWVPAGHRRVSSAQLERTELNSSELG